MRLIFFVFLLLMACSPSDNGSPVVMNNDNTTNNNTDTTGDNTDTTGMTDGTFMASYQGNFVSSAHETSGLAEVNQDMTILRFTDFKTSTGPILDVYLATDETAKNFVDIGELQGIEGDFDYDLPQGVDYETYKYVIIWCVEAKVNFGYAVLEN